MKIFISLLLAVIFVFALDINNASEKELISLKGIGPSKAKAIIQYRKEHCFKKVSEFTLVKGIGVKTLEKNIDNLSVSKCK